MQVAQVAPRGAALEATAGSAPRAAVAARGWVVVEVVVGVIGVPIEVGRPPVGAVTAGAGPVAVAAAPDAAQEEPWEPPSRITP